MTMQLTAPVRRPHKPRKLGDMLAGMFENNGWQGAEALPVLPSRVEPDPPVAVSPGPTPQTGLASASPADARPDYGSLLAQTLGPRPELRGTRKVAAILGPMLMSAAGDQASANQMIANINAPQRDWDERNRQALLTAVQWQRDDDKTLAERNAPQFFSGNEDRVRFDPASGEAVRVYDATQDFDDYATAIGLKPGSEEYFNAVQDYVLRGDGPTVFQQDRDMALLRHAQQLTLEHERQRGREALRQLPTYRDQNPLPRGGRRGAPATDDLPLITSPTDALKLPSGTRFRTPDGKVKRRP